MAEQAAPTPSKETPSGIRLLSTVALLVAIAKFIIGLLGLGLGAVVGITSSIFLGESFWGSTGWGIGQLIDAGLWLLVAYGLRDLKPWAWIVSVIAAGFMLLTAIQSFLTGGAGAPILGLLDLIIGGGILIYLFRSKVTQAFGR